MYTINYDLEYVTFQKKQFRKQWNICLRVKLTKDV